MSLRGLFLLAGLVPACLAWGAPPPNSFAPGEVLVKFRQGNELAGRAAILSLGGTVVKQNATLNILTIHLPGSTTVEDGVRYFRSRSFVQFAEPNYVRHYTFAPNDPLYPSQYHHQRIQTPTAWDVNMGSPQIKIAILDSGIDNTHPDLSTKLVEEWDFVNNDSRAEDNVGHGTHVSGCAAAATNNGIGVAAPGFNCVLMMGKVGEAFLLVDDIVEGITWAANRGAHVINMSFGGYGQSQAERTAVDYAWGRGVVLVGAAGNDNVSTPLYPASFPNCINVAASNQSDQKAGFSNYGPTVDVAAPGQAILSTVVGGGYEAWDGTSMASPVCAGVVALLWSQAGGLATNAEIRQYLESTCDNIGNFVVHGRINATRAVNIIPVYTELPVTPATVAVVQGNYVGGNAASIQANDGSYFQVSSVEVFRLGYVGSAEVGFQTAESPANMVRLAIQVNAQAARGSTGFLYLWNWNANRYDFIRAFPMSDASAGNMVEIVAPKPYSKWVNGSGQLRAIVRGLTPARLHAPFVFSMDRVQLLIRKRL